MEDELDAEHSGLGLDIVTVNETGLESGNDDLIAVSTLPLVQDDAETDVWGAWGAEWRDVYVLDRENRVVAVFNLTSHDLSDSANYTALYELFVAAGGD